MQLVVKRTQIYNKCITTCVALLDCVSCPSHGLYIPCSCGQTKFYWGGEQEGLAWLWYGLRQPKDFGTIYPSTTTTTTTTAVSN